MSRRYSYTVIFLKLENFADESSFPQRIVAASSNSPFGFKTCMIFSWLILVVLSVKISNWVNWRLWKKFTLVQTLFKRIFILLSGTPKVCLVWQCHDLLISNSFHSSSPPFYLFQISKHYHIISTGHFCLLYFEENHSKTALRQNNVLGTLYMVSSLGLNILSKSP